MARTKRWAYTILDTCCPLANIEMLPGDHIPGDYDLEVSSLYRSNLTSYWNNK